MGEYARQQNSTQTGVKGVLNDYKEYKAAKKIEVTCRASRSRHRTDALCLSAATISGQARSRLEADCGRSEIHVHIRTSSCADDIRSE
jgi:hypothetical protein